MGVLERVDPEIFGLVRSELERQRSTLGMIASENFCSVAVLEANGSVFQNKYSEGYPGKRYYAGNEFVDKMEMLAIERAKKLFSAEHANVQPLSGAVANLAAYFAIMEPGDKFMGMNLAQGGHLTHGSPVNFSGKLYKPVAYSLDPETEVINYDAVREMAQKERPKMILCGYTVYPRTIDFKKFREICDEVGAVMMADIAHIAGLCAGGAHPNPFPYADVVTTTTHKTLRGPRGALIMCKQAFAEKVDKAVFPGLQGGPFDHANAAKAVCFHEALQPSFREYAAQIVRNARALADELVKLGYHLISGGTDNHLMLVDLRSQNITGKEAQLMLEEAGMVCNKNMIPNDPQKPFVTSGIRLGTPGLTTRGMRENEMSHVAGLIHRVLSTKDAEVRKKVRGEVRELVSRFPVYPELG